MARTVTGSPNGRPAATAPLWTHASWWRLGNVRRAGAVDLADGAQSPSPGCQRPEGGWTYGSPRGVAAGASGGAGSRSETEGVVRVDLRRDVGRRRGRSRSL